MERPSAADSFEFGGEGMGDSECVGVRLDDGVVVVIDFFDACEVCGD